MIISEKLPSRIELLPGFISPLLDKIKHLPLRDEDVFSIKLSLEEALINAIKHGNKLKKSRYVTVRIAADASRLSITVMDEGKGFNFKDIPDPTKEENLYKPTGRGVFLIKKLMDKVDFLNGGRQIKMIKLLKRNKGVQREHKRRKTG